MRQIKESNLYLALFLRFTESWEDASLIIMWQLLYQFFLGYFKFFAAHEWHKSYYQMRQIKESNLYLVLFLIFAESFKDTNLIIVRQLLYHTIILQWVLNLLLLMNEINAIIKHGQSNEAIFSLSFSKAYLELKTESNHWEALKSK
jgi:hypothetical protein